MMLNYTISGEPSDLPPALLVHGLFGSGKNLGGLARRLDGTRQVIAVDMRNHGDSPRDPDHSYPALAGDLAEVIAAHGGIADVVGHSMGGKASMALALTRPALVRRLVVMDIAPYVYAHSQMDLIRKMQAMDLTGLKLRSESDRRLAASIPDPGVRAFLLQSLNLKADPPAWKMNLPALADQMSSLTGWPQDVPRGTFEGPALFLGGARSDYMNGAAIEAIHAWFPDAGIRMIEGCGHWLHAEKPELIADLVANFLS